MQSFATRLLRWFDAHGRHDLPWQHPRDAYRVWVSEVMLQQTQVATVIPYFARFMARFPDLRALASAPQDDVLRHWAGLGYYARARNLHRAAQLVVERHRGTFPQNIDAVSALPGVGRSTAGAILAQAHGQRQPILDGNVRRVLARHAGIEGWTGLPKVQAQLWTRAESLLPDARLADYTQALMDLGSLLCRAKAPDCLRCPVREDCVAQRESRTATLPSPKPARARPRREARLLLVRNARGEWLVQQRAPAGIWGGLWCPPLASSDEDWKAVATAIGASTEAAQMLAPVRHAFTHFDLDLLPLLLSESPNAAAVSENAARAWIKLAHPDSWPGLPSPIRKLFEALHAQVPLPLTEDSASPCPAPSTASSSKRKPKASTARPTPARSASASSTASRKKAGSSGSSTRHG